MAPSRSIYLIYFCDLEGLEWTGVGLGGHTNEYKVGFFTFDRVYFCLQTWLELYFL
jgi:hypothetical protein